MKRCIQIVMTLFVFSCSLQVIAAPQWQFPVLEFGKWHIPGEVTAIVSDQRTGKVYAGIGTTEALRRNLLVFDSNKNGVISGEPRRYAGHVAPQPPGNMSTVRQLLLDHSRRMLYVLQQTTQTDLSPLVAYHLNAGGEPIGAPIVVATGLPLADCQAIAMHPKLHKLYAISQWSDAVAVVTLDAKGTPVGAPTLSSTGQVGKGSIAIRPDGRKLYLGTLASTLEVCDISKDGKMVGTARTYPLAEYAAETPLYATTPGVYYRGTKGKLHGLPLNSFGEPSAAKTITAMAVQAVAASGSDRLLIAEPITFIDAINRAQIVSGVQVKEIRLSADGAPGPATRTSQELHRKTVAVLGAAPGAIAVVSSLGDGFLGNKISGLFMRVTLESMTPSGNTLAQSTTISMGNRQQFLSFAYAPSQGTVYAVDERSILDYFGIPKENLMVTFHKQQQRFISVYSLASGSVSSVPCADADEAIAVDDTRGLLYVARTDGTVAVRMLNGGIPAYLGETVPVGTQSITAISVNPSTNVAYILGTGGGVPATDGLLARHSMVVIPITDVIAGTVVDPVENRLYAVTKNHGIIVWTLAKDGSVLGEARTDTRSDTSTCTGMLLDSVRRRLYVSDYPDPATGKNVLLVYTLDRQGYPVGVPKQLASPLAYGGPDTRDGFTLSRDGKWLLAAGTGNEMLYAFALDSQGNPTGEVKQWLTDRVGRCSLVATTNPHILLAGNSSSALEVVRLGDDGLPVGSVKGDLEVENIPIANLDLLSSGSSSPWISLDDVLKNGDGSALSRVVFSGTGTPLKTATVKFEVAFGHGTQPVATVTSTIAGNYAALFLPRYGQDDVTKLASLIENSSERYKRYLMYAQNNPISADERPKLFPVVDSLHQVDSSPQALEYGIKALSLLGKNTLSIGNYVPSSAPYLDPSLVRELALENGIERTMCAVYNPEGYFDYLAETQTTSFLDDWAKNIRSYLPVSGFSPDEVALFHLADEPGWYYPTQLHEAAGRVQSSYFGYVGDPITEQTTAQRLEHFRGYLKSKGMSPQDFGKAQWDEIAPIGRGSAVTLPDKRLFYWTMRYFPESFSQSLANNTHALKRQFNSNMLTASNLNNWPGIFLLNTAGVGLDGSQVDTGTDSGRGNPDWFDLGRKNAITTMWTEDWFGDNEAQRWSLYSDLLRCASRHGTAINFGAFIIGNQTHAMSDGGAYKVMALAGHGGKAIDNFTFGPYAVLIDGWSEMPKSYISQADGYRLLGKSEKLLFPGKPRNGTVAIHLPIASQVWVHHTGAWNQISLYMSEIYGLHAALIHEQYTVDFVDDIDLEEGALEKYGYATFYMTGANLSEKAQNAVLAWVARGGTLVMLPGAGVADEYDEPLSILTEAAGATCGRVERILTPGKDEILQHLPKVISFNNASLDVKTDATALPTTELTLTDANTIATLPDGSPVLANKQHGDGNIFSFGYWPGYTYWTSPDRNDSERLPYGWAENTRLVITAPARIARTKKVVDISQPLVEGVLLESEKGTAVTLMNWSGTPFKSLTVTLHDTPAVLAAAKEGTLKLSSVRQGALKYAVNESSIVITLPLKTVDVLMFE